MKSKPSKTKTVIFQLSALLILFAAVFHSFNPEIAKYVMAVAVVGFAGTTFTSPYPGKSLRGKRLFNIQVFAVLLMAVSAYLMYVDIKGWVVTLLISAILTLYSTIFLSREYKEEQNSK